MNERTGANVFLYSMRVRKLEMYPLTKLVNDGLV